MTSADTEPDLRRRLNPRVVAIGGGALAAVVVGAAILMLSGGGGEPDAVVTSKPATGQDESATAEPSATPGEPSPSPFVTVPYDPASLVYPASFDDGIDPADLPPLAERLGQSHPPSHVMEPWVWDHVGPGWGLATVMDYPDAFRWSFGGSVELYLVSPEGVFFDLFDIGSFSYGAGVAWGSLDTRTALVGISAEGGSWEQWMDLETGDVLGVFDEFGEGGGMQFSDWTVYGFVDGTAVREVVAESEEFLPEPRHEIIHPDGTIEPIAPPVPGLRLAGGRLPLNYDESPLPEALFVAGSLMYTGSDAIYEAYALDVAANTFRAVDFAYPGGFDECSSPGPLIDGAAIVTCPTSEEESRTFRVFEDGSAPIELDAQPVSWWRPGYVDAWSAQGFDLTVSDYFHVTDIFDIWNGDSYLVYHDPMADQMEGSTNDLPTEFAPGLFIIEGTDAVVGYDRATGERFTIVPAILPDSGLHNGMTSYTPLWTEES